MPRIKSPKARSRRGSITLLVVVCLAAGILLILLPALNLAEALLLRQQQSAALEEAALVAAKSISEIVVNDPYFGYVGFTDQPTTGKKYFAADGQPLPVIGINTLIASCRNQLLVANMLDNDDLRSLAKRDIFESRRLASSLTDLARESLSTPQKSRCTNGSGDKFSPGSEALTAFSSKQLNHSENASALVLSLGWLDDFCDSGINIPRPLTDAAISPRQQCMDNYRAFVNIPVKNEDFYFGGYSDQPSLVDPRNFKAADGKRLCTIVCASSDIKVPACNIWRLLTGSTEITIHCLACAEPQSNQDVTLPGILRVSLSSGYMNGIDSIGDLLTYSRLTSSKSDLYKVVGGDYPQDNEASLVVTERQLQTPQIVARGLFDWIRSTHNKARLDAIVQVVRTPFKQMIYNGSGSATEPSFVFEFDLDGKLLITNEKHSPFLNETVDESQVYSVAEKAVQAEDRTWNLSFRDQVNSLGTASGGKHAGQPMPGNPINWSELPYYDGSSVMAQRKASGTLRGVIPLGDNKDCEGGSEAVSLSSTVFQNAARQPLTNQPNKTYYASGLAVEMRFSEGVSYNSDGGNS